MWTLTPEFKNLLIIRKSKNRKIKVTRKFPNLQYLHITDFCMSDCMFFNISHLSSIIVHPQLKMDKL